MCWKETSGRGGKVAGKHAEVLLWTKSKNSFSLFLDVFLQCSMTFLGSVIKASCAKVLSHCLFLLEFDFNEPDFLTGF